MSIIDKFLDVMRLNDDDYEFCNRRLRLRGRRGYEDKEKKPSRENAKKKRNSSRPQQLLIFPKNKDRNSKVKLHRSTGTAVRDSREWKYV